MSEPPTYYDRASGAFLRERVYAAGLLHWLYNSRGGALVERALTTRCASCLYGWANNSRFSRRRIRPFVERMGIEMRGCSKRIDEFQSFAEFFIRTLDPAQRPIGSEPDRCVAPADGRVLAYPRVEAGREFRIKRSRFDLGGLLRDPALARAFDGGSMLISRLSLADCHHFHFPDSGVPSAAVSVPGRLQAGGPYALGRLIPFFAENYRMLTPFRSDHFGPMLIVEIGALSVGSIRQGYRPGERVAKGQAKGFFELGGSTVVLLFQSGAIRLDDDLCRMTAADVETYVRMGEPIGRTPSL